MRHLLTTLFSLLWAVPALAHHDQTPLREATINGHSHTGGGAMGLMVAAAVLMVVALVAVNWVVMRKP